MFEVYKPAQTGNEVPHSEVQASQFVFRQQCLCLIPAQVMGPYNH